MECLSQEPVLFEDVLCQMHDMIQPAKEGCFTLADLKRHKQLAGTLFNMLFNLHKFIAFETRDPFLARQVSISEWSATFCTVSLGTTAIGKLRHCSSDSRLCLTIQPHSKLSLCRNEKMLICQTGTDLLEQNTSG